MLKLPYVENLNSKEVHETDIWNNPPKKVPKFSGKTQQKQWQVDPTTKWYFLSGFVGEVASQRVSLHNPPRELRAFIADYDVKLTAADMQKLSKKLARSRFRPSIAHQSPNGALRLIWHCRTPIGVDLALAKQLLKIAGRKLGLVGASGQSLLTVGLDVEAWVRPEQTYCFWPVDLSVQPNNEIDEATLYAWKAEALDKLNYKDEAVALDLEAVSTEAQKRFPQYFGGGKGLKLGDRHVRFWDPVADNETAAVVCENGMKCYTGPTPFMSWASILGKSFVEEFEEQKFGNAVGQYFCDGSNYWGKVAGSWAKIGYPQLFLNLKAGGLETAVVKGEALSQLEKALSFINTEQQISGLAPYIYREEVVKADGQIWLNSARCVALKPWPERVSEKDFPRVWQFLNEFFARDKGLVHYLNWLKRAYEGAVKRKPELGQACMLVGPKDCGKTFITNQFLSRLMGGAANAEPYLTGEERFNEDILESGVAYIDDGSNSDSIYKLGTFTQNLKQFVANSKHRCRGMFKKGVQVEWKGRLVLNANDDPESLQSIPDLTVNSSDKMNLYKIRRPASDEFPTDEDLVKELPKFGRWLIDRSYDHSLMTNKRFGTAEYQDPDLAELVKSAAAGAEVEELVDLYYTTQARLNGGKVASLKGTATEIMESMRATGELAGLMHGYKSPSQLGRALKKLAARYPDSIRVTRPGNRTTYEIPEVRGG